MAIKGKAFTIGDLDPAQREAFELMLGQLPIVWARQSGGVLRVPIAEVDACAPFILDFRVEGADFVFTLRRKD